MRTFLFVFLVLAGEYVSGQTIIAGKIIDLRGKPVPGASISIKDSYDGTTADSTGAYKFKTTEKGNLVVVVSCMGYKPHEQAVALTGGELKIDVRLKEKIDELAAVTVTAGSFEASDRKRAAAVLNTLDVLTVGGANADITAAVKTLPGAQQVGESEGLFVRGGAGYETRQFIDGMAVANPFFTGVPDIASRGRFSPGLFKGTVFSTGGYSALYGQALSSAVILESVDLPERSSATASISSVFIGAGIQELSKNKKASYGLNYGYTNLLPYFKLVKQTPEYFRIPEFHGGDANFRIKTKSGGMVKLFTSFSYNVLGLKRADIDSIGLKNAFGLNNINWYNNLSWRENLGGGWKVNVGISYSFNKDQLDQRVEDEHNKVPNFNNQPWLQQKNFEVINRQDLSQARLVLERKLHGISVLRFGGEYWYQYNSNKYNSVTGKLEDHLSAGFAEADLYITNSLAAKAGARIENSTIIDRVNIAPRLSFAYKTGKGGQVSLAYGMFYQKPEVHQLAASHELSYAKATHYIINYQKTVTDRIFRIEAFYKVYDELVKSYPVYSNNGNGYAKGIEVFWRDKKTVRNLDYWVSYSYLKTERNHQNFPYSMQPSFAAEHTSSIVLKRFVSSMRTGFNFTYSVASGRPYFNLQQQNGSIRMMDKGTTKAYQNLGFSLNYVTSYKKAFVVLVASVTNVLGNNQVLGYNYSYDGKNKQAITPPAERFFFLGAFFSWGTDRTQDAINNNL